MHHAAAPTDPVDPAVALAARTCATRRLLPWPVRAVWAALVDPVRLARWWGPAGFLNEFRVCEPVPGGRWLFDMVGPDGQRYANESRFVDLQPGERLVIEHLNAPHFTLTLTLSETQEPEAPGCHLDWVQVFDDAEVLDALRAIVGPANEQNLDRLSTEILAGARGA